MSSHSSGRFYLIAVVKALIFISGYTKTVVTLKVENQTGVLCPEGQIISNQVADRKCVIPLHGVCQEDPGTMTHLRCGPGLQCTDSKCTCILGLIEFEDKSGCGLATLLTSRFHLSPNSSENLSPDSETIEQLTIQTKPIMVRPELQNISGGYMKDKTVTTRENEYQSSVEKSTVGPSVQALVSRTGSGGKGYFQNQGYHSGYNNTATPTYLRNNQHLWLCTVLVGAAVVRL